MHYRTSTSGTNNRWKSYYNRPPSRIALQIPLRVDIAHYPDEQLSIRLEASHRITTTDVLDGASLAAAPILGMMPILRKDCVFADATV